MEKMKKGHESLQKAIWAGLILFLPVTSMPAVIRLVGSDSVAAPSVLFLFVFMLVWFFPFIRTGGALPGEVKPFLYFIVFAILTTVISNFSTIPIQKGYNPFSFQVSAILTLVIGAAFYFAFSLWPVTPGRMKFTLKLMNTAGFIMLVWAGAQAAAWYGNHSYPQWMRDFHELFSAGPLNRQRVMGFALEPSWLAHQLNMVFLPIWLAFSVKKYSVHKFRVFGFSIENLFLGAGVIILFLTLSRIGLMAFLTMLGYLLVRATQWTSRRISLKLSAGSGKGGGGNTVRRIALLRAGIFIGFCLVFIMVILGAGLFLSKFDIRTAKLFHFDLNQEDPILYYAQQINIAARLVYWQAGWNIFEQHPWLGVGLGNAGFYIPANLSNYALGLVEVRQLLFRSDVLLNIKCLWARILAETGIIGFIFFITWMIHIWFTGRMIEKRHEKQSSSIGLAVGLSCIALIFEGFSIDTFALPYIWIIFGLATAVLVMTRNQGESIEF